MKQLENHLGVQLLQRTTRHVNPTPDGIAYYQHCVRLLADLDDTEALFSESRRSPQGTLRIDMASSIGRLLVMPALGEFCERYPRIDVVISINDRPVDLIREGIDCVIRAGQVLDDSLVARPLAQLLQVTCASPDYLARHGLPDSLEALASHQAVNYFSSIGGKHFPMEFDVDGSLHELDLPGRVAVSGAGAYVAAGEAGLGLIQAPRYHVQRQLQEGSLVEILPQWRPPAMPVFALYPPHRQLSQRVRVFVEWAQTMFS